MSELYLDLDYNFNGVRIYHKECPILDLFLAISNIYIYDHPSGSKLRIGRRETNKIAVVDDKCDELHCYDIIRNSYGEYSIYVIENYCVDPIIIENCDSLDTNQLLDIAQHIKNLIREELLKNGRNTELTNLSRMPEWQLKKLAQATD